MIKTPSFLRPALMLDALVSGATGLLLLLGAGFLTSLLSLPENLLRYTGLALIPYALYVAFIATRRPIPEASAWTIIIANLLWAVASVALLRSGWLSQNAFGAGFVLFQALVVAAFAAVQFMALRRMEPVPA